MHEIPKLDAKGLRHFALSTGAIVAGLFGLALPWLFGWSIPWWPFVLAAVLSLWGLLAPATLRPVYRGWMSLGLLLIVSSLPAKRKRRWSISITAISTRPATASKRS